MTLKANKELSTRPSRLKKSGKRTHYRRFLHSITTNSVSRGLVRVVKVCLDNDHREGAESMYYFSTLALTLNEPEDEVAPTDSRRRPDQRLMEEGHWDEANAEKQRLEEKQRSSRREREREAVKSPTSPEEGKVNGVCFSLFLIRRVCICFFLQPSQSNNDPPSKSKRSHCAPVWSAL